MKKVTFIFLYTFLFLSNRAQERLGISNSNYYSTAAIQLNPSASVNSKTYMQCHLAGFNVFAKTNLVYLPDFTVAQLSNPPDFMRKEGNGKKFLYLNGSLEALSFVISKRTYGAGFFIRGRSVMDMRRVSYELANVLLDNWRFTADRNLQGQNFKNAKISNMSWVEYGLNFGKMIKRQQDVLITLGGNLKYLTGINIMYTNILDFNGYNHADGSFEVRNINAKMLSNSARWRAGRGLGLDLGITYKVMNGYVDKYYANSKLSNCKYVDYKYKIGLSLRDAGFIRFRGGTEDTRIIGSGHFNPDGSDTTFSDALKYNFNSTTVSERPILASLPTALTAQFDYNFNNYIYFNVTAVKNLVPVQVTGVQSPDLLSVCPRVEFRQIEVGMPLTLYRFIYPQLGFALRYRSFVAGVDNVFPLFLPNNTYGLNLYVSLAVSVFRNSACDVKRTSVSDCPRYKRTGKNKPKKRKNFSSGGKR